MNRSPAFQITNLSQVSSEGKPLLSSLKRKCSSETLGFGKGGSSSNRCHCSKKSKLWNFLMENMLPNFLKLKPTYGITFLTSSIPCPLNVQLS
ncbi:hypothetical protein RJT34_11695 [Clitoria ternatea]|uniref:Uncharacterized protein n=1 Tax=Clitoria ternatea TaxID=43366 RepID=A0AAN9PKA0_CLITE